MTRTQYFTATSVDGYIADADNSLEWLFEVPRNGGSGAEGFGAFFAGVGAMAMGATTYEWVMEHEDGRWPYTLPTWVFTHRDLPVPDGGAVRLTSEPAVEVHRQMVEAAAGKDVWLVGGGDLVGQFLDHDLLDEIWVSIAPLVLGRGAPLLPRRRTTPMRVLEVRHQAGGPFVHVHYSLR